MRGIVTADWHIRKDIPRCRLDEDWLETQRKAIEFIVKHTNEKDTDLYILGDIFNTSRQPSEVINMVLDELKKIKHFVYILAGNHELPYHNYNGENKSPFGVLRRQTVVVKDLPKEKPGACHFGEKIHNPDSEMIFLHELVFPSEKDRPHKDVGKTAKELLKEYPKAKWIFVGDYHHHFHYEENGRHVINPGCILRQAADLIDYQPVIYYIDTYQTITETEIVRDRPDLVTDLYLKQTHERETRIDSFIELLDKNRTVTLDFLENLKAKAGDPGISHKTKEILNEVIEEINQ